MTASSWLRSRPDGGGHKPEAGLSWAAVAAAAGAVFAWAACCVLPMALGLAGVGLGSLSWFAGQRTWITLVALAVIGLGWVLTWRRARMCRLDRGCAVPSPLGVGLLAAASVLVLLALIWQPIIEPRALALIRSAR